MLVLDALFGHILRISSHVEIVGSLAQRLYISASDVRVGCAPWKGGAFQWVRRLCDAQPGDAGMKCWVGLGVIADNVINIGHAMEKQSHT